MSQDLLDKQIELLERKYGGRGRANNAARVIQRSFRHYSMRRKFATITAMAKADQRRLSRRLHSELVESTWSTTGGVMDNKNNGRSSSSVAVSATGQQQQQHNCSSASDDSTVARAEYVIRTNFASLVRELNEEGVRSSTRSVSAAQRQLQQQMRMSPQHHHQHFYHHHHSNHHHSNHYQYQHQHSFDLSQYHHHAHYHHHHQAAATSPPPPPMSTTALTSNLNVSSCSPMVANGVPVVAGPIPSVITTTSTSIPLTPTTTTTAAATANRSHWSIPTNFVVAIANRQRGKAALANESRPKCRDAPVQPCPLNRRRSIALKDLWVAVVVVVALALSSHIPDSNNNKDRKRPICRTLQRLDMRHR